MSPSISAWESQTRTLTPERAAALASSGLLRVELVTPPDRWKVTADSRVGIVVGDGWEERVVPRIAVPKLMFLLSYAKDPRGWRDILAPMGREDDLYSAVAAGFATLAARALEPGPLRGYVTIDEASNVLRGRLRAADQATRRFGMPLPVEITRDDYTIDIVENQLLAAAATLLLRLRRVPEFAGRRLRRVRGLLAGVSPPATPDAPAPTRLNARYAAALVLASLILRHGSVSTHEGGVRSASFVFDMNAVFEDFLSAALTDALRPYGGHTRLQHSAAFLDREAALRLKPDITWWSRGRVRAIIDAKYKALEGRRFPNADAYQMLAYCSAFGLSEGTLAYARDAGYETRAHTLPHGITLRVRAIDVEQPPELVLAQVDELARDLVAAARY